jgi:hypothetical protein
VLNANDFSDARYYHGHSSASLCGSEFRRHGSGSSNDGSADLSQYQASPLFSAQYLKLVFRFTSFATFILHNSSFTWTMSTPHLRLDTLGTIFDHVSLTKDISFQAFRGPAGLRISNFQLSREDPAGFIEIDTNARIPSPARWWTCMRPFD